MSNNIVQVNVSQTIAPAPSQLQNTGAFISQGGTNLAAGTYSLLTSTSSLTALTPTAQALTALTWLSSVATGTVAGGHGYTVGEIINLTIAGCTPSGYNGTFACTIASSTTFTYALASNPGAETVLGTVINASVAQVLAMTTTFFAQGASQSVYVLELGSGTAAQGVTALGAFITNKPNFFYSYLVPRGWDAEPTFASFVINYNATTSKTYFFVTATLATYTNFTALDKCVFMLIEAAGIGATEFSLAGVFYTTLNYAPSSSNKVPPLCFSYVVGVTAYAATGTQIATFKAANLNYISTGAEGRISNTLVVWGNTCDGNPFNYWYSVDWSQINLDLNLSNTIINGSNTNINPLYFNQQGIDTLQASAVNTMSNAISYGLALGTVVITKLDPTVFANNVSNGVYVGSVVINAVPFALFNSQNPSDYSIGLYTGLAAVYTPARGFEQIIVNLNVSNFA